MQLTPRVSRLRRVADSGLAVSGPTRQVVVRPDPVAVKPSTVNARVSSTF